MNRPSSSPQPQTTMGPEAIHQLYFAFAPSYVLAAAVQLDLFSRIAAAGGTAAEVAQAGQLSPRGVGMLLDLLAALGLLVKTGQSFELTDSADRFLVRQSPDYIGVTLEHEPPWNSWSHLVETIRTGKPYWRLEQQDTGQSFFPLLVRNLHVVNREPARRAAQVLGAGATHSSLSVIDIACGSGVWGIAIAECDRRARITAQDFPGMLDITRQYLKQHQVEDRYDFLPGDLKEVEFGRQRFDLALLGNIVHSEGESSSRRLFQRLSEALRPGARIAIIDMVPNDERTGPVFPLIFALHMLVNTRDGGTFTFAEYDQWLKEAGFSRVQTADIGSHSPMIIGTKE